MEPIWILAGIFMVTCGLLYATAEAGSRRRRRVYERLGQIQTRWQETQPVVSAAAAAVAARPRDLLPGVSHALERGGIGERLKWRLTQAGLSLRPSEFVAMVLLAGMAGGGLGMALGGRAFALLLAVVGLGALPVALGIMRSRRVARFSDQFPDALILIASSIRSGYSFLRAIQVAAAELPDPMRQELERCVREAEIGFPLAVALQNMTRRVPSYDLELMVTAVAIQMQVGGNLSEILDTIASTIRERVRTRRHIAALTAEGRLSGIVAFAMPWAMFLLIQGINPEYMKKLTTEPMGLALLGGAFVWQIIGGLVIWRQLSIDL